MTFRENLNRICKQKDTTLTSVIKELGISTSKVTAINKGSMPSEELLFKLAKHLDCPVKDFFADEELNEVQSFNEDELDIIRIFRSLSRRYKHEFMAMVYEFENKKD